MSVVTTNVAPEVYTKHPVEIRRSSVAFSSKLDAGDTIVSANATVVVGPQDLVVSGVSVNSTPVTVKGKSRQAGSVVQFTTSGGSGSNTYLIRVDATCLTGQVLVGIVTVRVSEETS